MFKPSRLFAIKLLGLWGSTTPKQSEKEERQEKNSNQELTKSEEISSEQVSSLSSQNVSQAIQLSQRKIIALMLEQGIPGLTISVSRRGNLVWQAGFGFCDVENQLSCDPDAKMRVASISKSIFAATVIAPLIEENHIKLDDSVHQYLTQEEFPKLRFQDKEYDVTVRQLLSHTSGIRHYDDLKQDDAKVRAIGSKGSKKIHQNDDQYNRVGFYQRKTYRNVLEALEPFKNEPLVKEPGQFQYTTYGYTLLSAVAQKAIHKKKGLEEEDIEDHWIKVMRREWNMRDTFLDHDEVILSKRARYYLRTGEGGSLINAPYADNSVKWAGGGLVSNTNDLVKFANQLIDSYDKKEPSKLKRETLDLLWTEVKDSCGLGFFVSQKKGNDSKKKLVVYHGGGALGATSFLIIYPDSKTVVAVLTNLGFVKLSELAFYVADKFEELV